MDLSPYLSAIQSLQGETPGEKCKDLHRIAIQIIENDEERDNFIKNGITERVPSALHSKLRIIASLKLKSKDAIVEALKSDDVSIIKLALGANWFFNASNDLVNVDYFSENVLPFVSLRTRLELIDVLSKFLTVQQAESFHSQFVVLFGSDQAMPLLVACGEDYIHNEVMKNKILLSDRMLKKLYRKYPGLVIGYLRFIKNGGARNWRKKSLNKKRPTKRRKRTNKSDLRENMVDYQNFLPNLVKNHAREFCEFYLSIPWNRIIKLGSTRAEFFLENAIDILVEHPRDLLGCLPFRLVKSKLSKQQSETMLRNLLPKNIKQFRTWEIESYIKKYYPEEGRFEILRENFKKAYGQDLLEHKEFLNESVLVKMMPLHILEECARKLTKRTHELPPKEAIPLLKEQLKKSSGTSRGQCLCYMLESCDLYGSKKDLLEVLQYYNSFCRNEQGSSFVEWLSSLSTTFNNMDSLDKEHWEIIKEIVLTAYVKGDIFTQPKYSFKTQTKPLTAILRNFLKLCKTDAAEESDKVFLDKIINIILELYCEHDTKWDFMPNEPEIEKMCLEKCLAIVPQKYSEIHAIWKRDKNKLHLTSYFVERIGKYNETNSRLNLYSNKKASNVIVIQHFSWLAKFLTELFINKEEHKSSREYTKFKKYLYKYFPELRQNLIDEHSLVINDVTTDDALVIMKQDRSKIIKKINEYVTGCRCELNRGRKSTKRFVMSLKWYQDIPIQFAEKCLNEIEKEGSILILGILLEGNVLSKIIEPYLPKEAKLEIENENAKKGYQLVSSLPRALNYSNPPPSLETLMTMCKGDYLSLALQTLSGIARRVPINKVLHFANHLTNNAISVKKAGIRLVFQVSPKPQGREFLKKLCQEENNPGIREVIAQMVYEIFTQVPNEDSWQLMKELIHSILPDDKNIFDLLKNFKSVNIDFTRGYLLEIFQKIDSFSNEDLQELEKQNLIRSFFEEIKDPQVLNKLPNKTINKAIAKNLLEYSSDFIFDMYLFSDEQKFEGRLEVIIRTLSENLMQLNESDSERSRMYSKMEKIYEKFGQSHLIRYLEGNQRKEMSQRFIMSVLDNVFIQKDFTLFINFNIFQIYMKASNAKSFGKLCGENIDSLIKIYNSETIIEYYRNHLQDIVGESSFDGQHFEIINGLKSHKLKYGVLVGLELLSSWFVKDYDERYDKFIEAAMASNDITTQVFLYKFLRESRA